MIRVGIIGCGKIAQVRHIPEYAALSNVVLAGFYDLNAGRAETLAQEYGGTVFSTYEEMLLDSRLDAVSVCVANSAHAEITVAALKAGKHVLCEKPMAMTLEECEEMVRVSKQYNRILMVGHNQRFAEAHQLAKKLIIAGEIGDIITFRTNFCHGGPESWSIDVSNKVWFFDKKKAILGVMADLGIHKTDLIHYLTGSTVKEVISMVETLDKKDPAGNKIEVDDNVICIYKLESGTVGTMTASWTCYGMEDNSTILYGTKGVMKLYCEKEHAVVVEKRDGTITAYKVGEIQTNKHQSKSGVIDEFVACIEEKRNPTVDGESALFAMRAVFAAVESGEKGHKICI